MCGICGIVNLNGMEADEHSVLPMMHAMQHRGPDDQGTFSHANVNFGFVRLSIIDLSINGHQPKTDESQQYTIVFNGEIYNYIELREELIQCGYSFTSNSDTEVLLKAYIKWGENCLDKLNGMFAFAVYCKTDRSVFIARDRFGIKPLYYYLDENYFIFASEIPSILSVYKKQNEANRQAVYDFLTTNRVDHLEETFFKGIKKIKHGYYTVIKDNKISFTRWYNLREKLDKPILSHSEFLELLSSSISFRLRSDVPVGVCLSGGIDSSTIVSLLLKKFGVEGLHTFSAIYEKGEKGNESEYIMLYRNLIENMHFTNPSADSLMNDQFKLIMAQAEPFTTTAIYAQYKVMELAHGKVKVLLDGQGADEQLAGYHYFFGYYYRELIREFRLGKLIAEISSYVKNHKSIYGLKVLSFLLLPSKLQNRYSQKNCAIHSNFNNQIQEISPDVNLLNSSGNLNESLVNHFEYKLEHLLKWEDLNSMHFSIESRIPFLDYRLVEATLSQSSDLIINKGSTKALLRESIKNIVPEKVRTRKDKIGFQTPEDNWFRKPLYKKFILDLLNSESFKSREIIDHKLAIKLYEKHLNNHINISKEIWKWINLELWYNIYIDN